MNKRLFVKNNLLNEFEGRLNVIVADVDWETFETVSQIKRDFNFINLSSEFAVNFILEYEKVDILILSRKIPNTEEITKKAAKKKSKVYIIGKDLKCPLEAAEVESLLARELEIKTGKESQKKRLGIKDSFAGLFRSKNRIISKPLTNISKPPVNINKPSVKVNKSSPNHILPGTERTEPANSEKPLTQDEDYFAEESNIAEENNIKEENNIAEENNINKNTKAIKQKIIIFTKAKGGVGSTILSIFLAHTFRKMKTLLVDLNFSEGGSDTGYYLNIPKSPNMIVFTEGYNRSAMDNAIVKIAENFDLLQPPPTYELAKKMDLQDIYSLIDIAKRKYHLIIFDLPNLINEMYLGVLDIADLVIMISDNTLGSIGRLISINNRFIYEDLEKILVINRTRNGNGLTYTKNQLRQFFNLKELVFLEEDNFLNGRTDFSNFNFDVLKNFGNLTNKVLDLLTYD
ncbi:MAG: AAA family ATPase [Actinobacteria bacterium]|nr:AAA family ATPase [Actinomycetota bacterium]MBU4451024.1 AAA family ATPase [Actinomycetota bacterium]MCG2788758.1 AAA family ATPase [Actinomycetes bacterium]